MPGGGDHVFLGLGWFELGCFDLFNPRRQWWPGIGPA